MYLVCLIFSSYIHTSNIDLSWQQYNKNVIKRGEFYKKYIKYTDTTKTFFDAIKNNNIPIIENLIESENVIVDENIQDHNKDTALHLLTYTTPHKNNILEKLLSLGANPDIKNNEGYTPLFYAVLCQNFDAVRLLIKYNANLNIQENYGKTVLHLAVEQPDYSIEIIDYLLRKGVDKTILDNQQRTALIIVSENNTDELLELFDSYRDRDEKSYHINKIVLTGFILLLSTGLFLLTPIGLTLRNYLTNIFISTTKQ
jgi:ankyrin repeat protein